MVPIDPIAKDYIYSIYIYKSLLQLNQAMGVFFMWMAVCKAAQPDSPVHVTHACLQNDATCFEKDSLTFEIMGYSWFYLTSSNFYVQFQGVLLQWKTQTHTSYEKVMGRITNWKQVSNRASANCTCCGRIPKIQRLRYECRDTANMWRRSRSILVFRGWMFFCLAFVCIPSPVVQRNPVTFTRVSTMPTECVLSTKYSWMFF